MKRGPKNKLSADDLSKIQSFRKEGISLEKIANRFNVSRMTIKNFIIKNNIVEPSIANDEIHFTGKPCRLGHTKRYIKSGKCVICARASVNYGNETPLESDEILQWWEYLDRGLNATSPPFILNIVRSKN